MSVEIPSDRENHQKENLTINEDPPSYSNEDSNQDIRGHLLTSPAFPISVPPNVLPIQEPDQYYPVPSRKLHCITCCINTHNKLCDAK